MFKFLRRRFFAGLLVIVPVVVTAWILWMAFTAIDGLLEPLQAKYFILDFPGVGFLAVILLVLLTGIFASNFVGSRIISWFENVLVRLPFIRRIYTAIKELSEVFLADKKQVFTEVVMVRYPHRDSYALGFVTDQTSHYMNQIAQRPLLNIFIPTTPNPTSGFLLFVPEEDVERLPITVEEGLKMVVSGGAFTPSALESSDS